MKRVIAGILTLCMLFSCIVAVPAVADTTEGLTMRTDSLVSNTYCTDYYYMKDKLTEVPHTFEAWVNIPTDVSKNGIIVGNYNAINWAYVNLSIQSGAPRLYYGNDMNIGYEAKFTDVDVRTGEWTHVAVTLDAKTREATVTSLSRSEL